MTGSGASGELTYSVKPGLTGRFPTVTNGRQITLTARWTGLDASKPYVASVEYPGGSGTFVEIN